MADIEEVIEGLEKVWNGLNAMEHELYADYVFDALELIKSFAPMYKCKNCHEWDCEGCEVKKHCMNL